MYWGVRARLSLILLRLGWATPTLFSSDPWSIEMDSSACFLLVNRCSPSHPCGVSRSILARGSPCPVFGYWNLASVFQTSLFLIFKKEKTQNQFRPFKEFKPRNCINSIFATPITTPTWKNRPSINSFWRY